MMLAEGVRDFVPERANQLLLVPQLARVDAEITDVVLDAREPRRRAGTGVSDPSMIELRIALLLVDLQPHPMARHARVVEQPPNQDPRPFRALRHLVRKIRASSPQDPGRDERLETPSPNQNGEPVQEPLPFLLIDRFELERQTLHARSRNISL
jgi:hypothetical protein